MSLGAIALRCLFSFAVLMVLLRLKGKHAVAEATAFDFVLALILGDMIDDALWAEVPLSQFVVAVAALVAADALVAWLAARSDRVYALVNGLPAVVIANGRRDRSVMRRELVNDEELGRLLREHELEDGDRRDLAHGSLEADGQLSIRKQDSERDAQRRDAPRTST